MNHFVLTVESSYGQMDNNNNNNSWTNLSGCVLESSNADDPADPVSVQAEQVLTMLKGAVFVPFLFLVGVVSIPISLMAFRQQGLHNRINLCLFSLELVNLVNVTFLLVLNLDSLYTPIEVVSYGPVFQFLQNYRLLGLLGFMYGAVYLSLLVSCERCISILFPLRAKVLFSTSTTFLLILLGTASTSFPFFLIAASYDVICAFDPQTLRSSVAVRANEFYVRHETLVNSLEGVYYGIVLSLGAPVLVFICTAVTGVKLRQTMNFRLHTSSSHAGIGKETAVTKMLIVLSVEFLILSLPSVVLRMVPLFETELSVGGRLSRSFHVLFNVAEAASVLNSSINFFVYYFVGSKFRESVRARCRCLRSNVLARTLRRLSTRRRSLTEDNPSVSTVVQ
ncbi:FMRFamide receptor-like [Pomacea canaliculata]|uniref:FMRFamide receptor-like n=1 Tax=Pomacea canaliculata TaxID=400727 RepID=UPI000D72830B|nr:FMRFamide receptor-like [Pomacea canaliculata]